MPPAKFATYLLAFINFTHIMDAMIMMPLGEIFINLYDISADEFSYLVSAYAFGAFSSALVGVWIMDRFDRRRALLTMYFGFSLGTLGCAFAYSFESMLILRFITGIFGGWLGALALSIISDLFKFEERGKAIGLLMAGFATAAALGVPFGLWLADQFGWQWPFIVIGLLGMIIVIMIYVKFPTMQGHINSDHSRSLPLILKNIYTDTNQVWALLLGVTLVMGHFLIIPFITPFMVRNVGFTQSQITLIYLIGGMMAMFSSPVVGKITDRIGAIKTLNIAMVLSFIPVIWLTNLGEVPIWYALIITSLFFIFGSGRLIPPNTIITATVPEQGRGSFMSVKAALQQLGIAMASLFSGWIVSIAADGKLIAYDIVGYISVGTCLVALLIARKLKVKY